MSGATKATWTKWESVIDGTDDRPKGLLKKLPPAGGEGDARCPRCGQALDVCPHPPADPT